MKLFFHFCSFRFSNCYVLGSEERSEAIIIDPGSMDKQLLECIENNNFNPRAILITHDHLGHVHGLRTLLRIYQAEIFAINRNVLDNRTTSVKDGDRISIGPFTVEVISIPGHSADSAVYRIGSLLFTGDTLSSGLVGSTASAYGAATQVNKLRSRLLSLPGDYTVLPGHGPPSTLEAERRFNVGISRSSVIKKRKPGFRLTI
ncbi:MAG: MBL fold metallo-hydrolase [Treponema sp.]|jgi:glyoxylase-like metal-dependent hydrolase (beta-lactamase superfamily II)|nr:MBL fold metallo-hydrolase [Treponema sp.]